MWELNSYPVISAGNHPPGSGKRRALTRELKAIKELQVQLNEMRQAAQPFLADAARKIYWFNEWESVVLQATAQAENNRRRFHVLRILALTSTIILPTLFIFNLSGTSSIAGRWLTFILSLIAALSTAMIIFFRFGDRWFLYQRLSNDLMSAGWDLANSSAVVSAGAWVKFTSATKAAKSDFSTTYKTTIITAAQLPTNEQVPGALDASVHAAVKAAFSGPALVDFVGWLGIEIIDSEGARVMVTEDREVPLRPDHRYNLVVVMATQRPSGVAEPLRITGGIKAATAEFSVVLDSSDPELRRPAQVLTVRTSGDSASVQFAFETRASSGPPWLWIRVAQRGRVVQNLELVGIPADPAGEG